MLYMFPNTDEARIDLSFKPVGSFYSQLIHFFSSHGTILNTPVSKT